MRADLVALIGFPAPLRRPPLLKPPHLQSVLLPPSHQDVIRERALTEQRRQWRIGGCEGDWRWRQPQHHEAGQPQVAADVLPGGFGAQAFEQLTPATKVNSNTL